MYRESPRAREVGAQVVVVIVFEIFPRCGSVFFGGVVCGCCVCGDDDDESDFVTKSEMIFFSSSSSSQFFVFFLWPKKEKISTERTGGRFPPKKAFASGAMR